MANVCRIDGCERPVKVVPRQLCNAHYLALQRSGPLPPLERFWTKVQKSDAGCWEWLGRRNRDGYGVYSSRTAHRVAYEKFYKLTVPANLHVDHLCRNHGCCNPDHLRPRDPHENMSDNGLRDRATCKHGHPWTPENTIIRQRNGRSARVCRACGRASQLRYVRHKRL